MKKQKVRQAKYADQNARDVDFKVGDPVYLRNHKKVCKLSPTWQPHYRIIEKKGPRTFRVKNQLTGEVVTSHAEHLVLAKVDWEPSPLPATGNQRTRLRNVVSDEKSISSDSEVGVTMGQNRGNFGGMYSKEIDQSTKSVDDEQERGGVDENRGLADHERVSNHECDQDRYSADTEIDEGAPSQGYNPYDGDTEVDEDQGMSEVDEEIDGEMLLGQERPEVSREGFRSPEDVMEVPEELIRPLKRQRSGTSSEEDIPLAELQKRLRIRRAREKERDYVNRVQVKPSIWLWGAQGRARQNKTGQLIYATRNL